MSTKQETSRPKMLKKAKLEHAFSESFVMDVSLPADFSFHKYKDLKAETCQRARSTRLGEPPDKSAVKRKFLTKGVWLNNNELHNLRGFDIFVAAVLENSTLLTLLDLSFNRIRTIDPIISKYCNLTILYFHGNQISDIEEVGKLHQLKKLRNLTLQGNPISDIPYYRKLVAAYIPGLVHLDHFPVLESFKKQAMPPKALKHLEVMKTMESPQCMTQEEADALSEEADRVVKGLMANLKVEDEDSYMKELKKSTKSKGKSDGIDKDSVGTLHKDKPVQGSPAQPVSMNANTENRRQPCCRCYLKGNSII